MKTKRHFYLMISCPGDVVNERKLLKDCVESINSERTDDVWVELQYWATDTSSDAGMLAQDSINEQIVKDSDGLIAIFNARLGTPVHQYKCGTDEEIALMLEAKKHVSLLFNTKPQIDLSNPTSIEQITKLQEYKKEQSQKAYYREFSDDEGFTTLARREILLWLRNITNDTVTHRESSTSIQEKSNNKNEPLEKQETPPPTDSESNYIIEILPSIEAPIDANAGALDCVVYITDAAQELTNELNNFSRCTTELNEKTNVFGDKFKIYKKQNNTNSGVIILCKQFSNEIDTTVTETNAILEKIESKWNEIYQYLMILNKNSFNYQDRIIVKDSVNSLKVMFVQALPSIDELINIFASIPNLQKDLKASINDLSSVYKHFKSFILKVISNCEELDTVLLGNLIES